MDFTSMNSLVQIMDLCEKYSKLNREEQSEFIHYIKQEFIGLDDEFSILIEHIFELFETTESIKDLETRLEELIEKYNINDVEIVIKSMIDYIDDIMEYLYIE